MNDLELHVSETTTQSSVIPVHWCISPELLQKLKQTCKIPYVLLVTAPEKTWKIGEDSNLEFRKLVPIFDLMGYVDFKCSGENIILAVVGPLSKLNYYLERTKFGYQDSIFQNVVEDEDQEIPEVTLCVKHDCKALTMIKVNVPKESFAKSPPDWEKTWVNLWFGGKNSHDQCGFRKRRLLAYSVQPIVMFLYMLLRIFLSALWFLSGQKINNWQATYDVINLSIEDVTNIDVNEISDRWLVIPGIKGSAKHLISVLCPSLWLFNLFCVYMFDFLWYAMPAAILVGFGLLIVCVLLTTTNFHAKFRRIYNNWQRQKQEKLIKETEQALICSGQRYFRPSDIPKPNRSIKIRFEGIKSKVCRPFSR